MGKPSSEHMRKNCSTASRCPGTFFPFMWNYAGLCSHCGIMPNALTMGAFMPEICAASGGGPKGLPPCEGLCGSPADPAPPHSTGSDRPQPQHERTRLVLKT
eukprot:COSAG02_NODE_35361_length_469_cov_1.145946_1_plen_101_part_10